MIIDISAKQTRPNPNLSLSFHSLKFPHVLSSLFNGLLIKASKLQASSPQVQALNEPLDMLYWLLV
jgi:hypothetical protein